MLSAKKIKDNIYWVGAEDYNLRDFHGYNIKHGTSYNAYLIIDDKITLIDSVKKAFTEEMLERIQSVIPIDKIDNIISNHSEFDHSGAIKAVIDGGAKAKVYATAAGVKTLTNLYGEMEYVTVKPNDTLSSGKYTFTFLPTPMVHWPDNMVTYIESEKILFSNDAFGEHLATNKILDTENDLATILEESRHYFSNIVLPYSAMAAKALSAVKALKIDTLAPSHGVVYTKHIDKVLKLYEDLVLPKKQSKAIIVYDTMWGNTEIMAKQIGAKFETICERVIYANLKTYEKSDVITEMVNAEYIAIGSPTLNNGLLSSVAAFMSYLTGLKPPKIKYMSFGSFGWAGGAIKLINEAMDKLGHEKIGELSVNFVPKDLDLDFIK